jgi:O-antigen ligase
MTPSATARLGVATASVRVAWFARIDRPLFLLFVAALPIVRPFYATLFGLVIPISDFIFALTATLWMVRVMRGQASVRWTWFYVPLALYFAALSVSAVFSINLRQSAVKLVGEAYLIAVAVLTINFINSRDDLKRVLQAWLVGTAITAAVGVAGVVLFWAGVRDPSINLALGGFGSLPQGQYPRLVALFENSNMLCNYLGVGLVMLPLMRGLGWIGRAWHGLLSAGAWLTAAFSFSPGLGGLLLSDGLFAWRRDRNDPRRRRLARIRLAAGTAAAIVFLAALFVAPASRGRPSVQLPLVDRAVEPSGRVTTWIGAMQTFLEHPVAGRGVGTAAARVTSLAAPIEVGMLRDAHNLWLSIAAQAGILGLAAFAAVAFHAWRSTRRSAKDDAHTALVKLGFRLAFLSVVLYQGIGGSFENARHVWVLMGLMVSSSVLGAAPSTVHEKVR